MNELQLFNNPEFGEIRVVEINGNPFAVGIDVARALEYVRPSQAVVDHCKGIRKLRIPSPGGTQETNIIPEGDIYRLIVKAADQSKNKAIQAKAEKFERWVFDEVLPTIRATGKYEAPAAKRHSLGEINSAARIITKELKEAGMSPQFRVVALKSLYAPVGVEIAIEGITVHNKLYDATTIAQMLGVYSRSGKPHNQAVAAIIAKLPILKGERENVPFQNQGSGHSGTNWQYTQSVVDKARAWLEQFNYPAEIYHQGKNYKVTYQREKQTA